MRFRPKKIRGSSKAGAPAHRGGWCWAAALRVQAWMVGVDSPGCRVDGRTTCDRRAHSRIASAGRLHSAAPAKFQRLPRAKNEILKKGSQTRSGGLRATREQGRCEGCVSAHSTRLSHSVTFDRVCLLAQAINAAPGKTEGRGSAAWQVPAVAVGEGARPHGLVETWSTTAFRGRRG